MCCLSKIKLTPVVNLSIGTLITVECKFNLDQTKFNNYVMRNFKINSELDIHLFDIFLYNLWQTSFHGSCPVIKGEKWVATKWLRDEKLENYYYVNVTSN